MSNYLTDWRETLRGYLAELPEHRSWVRFARDKDLPLCWEEVCAAYSYLCTERMTPQELERLMRELTGEIEG